MNNRKILMRLFIVSSIIIIFMIIPPMSANEEVGNIAESSLNIVSPTPVSTPPLMTQSQLERIVFQLMDLETGNDPPLSFVHKQRLKNVGIVMTDEEASELLILLEKIVFEDASEQEKERALEIINTFNKDYKLSLERLEYVAQWYREYRIRNPEAVKTAPIPTTEASIPFVGMVIGCLTAAAIYGRRNR